MYIEEIHRNANTPTDNGKYSSENGSDSQEIERYSMILRTFFLFVFAVSNNNNGEMLQFNICAVIRHSTP